ncbi:MAG TPA: GNAT family N-acetyltransferase [Candidatus Altiarchaeales archaeon]|nr:GNAT family N-acetyltransferase [Candidatus Altiarchaeales archaeon]
MSKKQVINDFTGRNYEARELVADDIPKIRQILRESSFFNQLEVKDTLKLIKDHFQYPDGETFKTLICNADGKFAGFLCYGTDVGEKTYEIHMLFVADKYKRNGVATHLLEHTEKKLRKNKCRMLYLYTSSSKEYLPARKLYQKKGFMKTAVVSDYFHDGDHKIIYAKRLKNKKNN